MVQENWAIGGKMGKPRPQGVPPCGLLEKGEVEQEANMRKHYDFSKMKAKPNPYAARLRREASQALSTMVKQYRIMIRHVKPALPDNWEEKVDRAGGEAACAICRLPLREHPGVKGAVVDCEGKLWHL